MSRPLKIFITYSHKNTESKDELKTHLAVLKNEGIIEIWHDNEILPGDRWRDAISTNLAESDILLYLVSADSLASTNCNNELTIALYKNIRPIPIILERCDWPNHELSNFQALPDRGNPINEWEPESMGWHNAVEGIRKVVGKMQSQAEQKRLAELAFQRGDFLTIIQNFDAAIRNYNQAIYINPNYADAYNNRGIAYAEKGDLDAAIRDFDKAIELNPNHVVHYYNRGTAYGKKDDLDAAIRDYNQAIYINPDHATAYNNRGTAYDKKDDLDAAIRDYNQAIYINPDHATAYFNRGAAYAKKGDLDAAIQDYNQAIEINPRYVDAYNNRGVSYADKGYLYAAIQDYNQAIELNPRYATAYNNRGIAHFQMNNFIDAIADYSKALELNPDTKEVYYNQGLIWLNLQRWNAAKIVLTTAKNWGMDIVASFKKDYGGVADFEQKMGFQLPDDIKELLTPQQ